MMRALLIGVLALAACDPSPTPGASGAVTATVTQITDRVWRLHDREAGVVCWFIQPTRGDAGGGGAIACIADSHYPGSVP
jgi:hypothetical protein